MMPGCAPVTNYSTINELHKGYCPWGSRHDLDIADAAILYQINWEAAEAGDAVTLLWWGTCAMHDVHYIRKSSAPDMFIRITSEWLVNNDVYCNGTD